MNAVVRVSEQLKDIAQRLDADLTQAAGERVAFALVVYTGNRASYISTASRDESREALRHLLAHWDAGMPDVPAHEVQ